MPGRLICFTGLDGCGLSTLAIASHQLDTGSWMLHTPGQPYLMSRSAVDLEVRDTSQTAHYFYYLSSVIFASAQIAEKLPTRNVYCVRYLVDTVVSHRAAGLNVDLVYEAPGYSIIKPDVTFFVNVPEGVRQARMDRRGKSALDKTLDNDKLRSRFQEEFERLRSHYVFFDNSSMNIEENARAVLNIVASLRER